jgi:hypothetical protein
VAQTRTTPAERELNALLAELAATGIDIDAIPPVMDTEQLASLLNMTPNAVQQARYRDMGIPYVKVGNRVRYLRLDVARWLLANRKSVGEPVPAGRATGNGGEDHSPP